MDLPVMPTAEQVLEQGKSASVNAVKTTVSDISTTVSDQVGISNETNSTTQNQNQQRQEPINTALEENQRTRELISDFYSPSEDYAVKNSQTVPQTDDQKLAEVRQKLHQELHNEVYYQNLISYEQSKPEERPAEKMERQEMEELQIKQQKQQTQELPVAVRMAQTHTETNPGIAG